MLVRHHIWTQLLTQNSLSSQQLTASLSFNIINTVMRIMQQSCTFQITHSNINVEINTRVTVYKRVNI